MGCKLWVSFKVYVAISVEVWSRLDELFSRKLPDQYERPSNRTCTLWTALHSYYMIQKKQSLKLWKSNCSRSELSLKMIPLRFSMCRFQYLTSLCELNFPKKASLLHPAVATIAKNLCNSRQNPQMRLCGCHLLQPQIWVSNERLLRHSQRSGHAGGGIHLKDGSLWQGVT